MLAAWPRAQMACETAGRVSGGAAVQEWQTLPVKERVAVYAYLTAGNASQQMRFHNVRVEALPFNQSDVHGLLGQRAVGPVPPIAKTNKLAAQDGSLTSTEQLSVDAAGTTIRATMAADGAVPQLQGEGAIEGLYTSYQVRRAFPLANPKYNVLDSSPPVIQVKYISWHGPGTFAHTRFKCPAPPVELRD